MKGTQGITITTWSGGQEPCERLIRSIWNVDYPVLFVINDSKNLSKEWRKKLYSLTGEQGWHIYQQEFDGFEIAAIDATLSVTPWEEFVLLQDTIEIKDLEVFNKFFIEYNGTSVAYNPHFQMYLGKYRRSVLEKMRPFPQIRDKIEAVRQEWDFTKHYRTIDGNMSILNPEFTDDRFYTSFEDMFGRTNLKMEDQYLIKRKGTWDAKQL